MKCQREQRRAAVLIEKVIEERHRLFVQTHHQDSEGAVFRTATTAKIYATHAKTAAENGSCHAARQLLRRGEGRLRAAYRFAKHGAPTRRKRPNRLRYDD